ncbi:MAG TPA: oxidoreductase [Ktedonobacterales bacterium]
MLSAIDTLLDRVTMYRLTVYVLGALLATAAVLAGVGILPFSPVSLVVSVGILSGLCWATNKVLARIFGIPSNVESALITAFILALIIDPIRTPDQLAFYGWVSVLAMASKYILSLKNRHFFNPAAIAVVVTGLALSDTASWWLATTTMLPVTIIGGWLIVRKLGEEAMVGIYVAAALVTAVALTFIDHTSLLSGLQQLLVASPLFFVGGVMLTEPLTAPPTRGLKRIYGIIMGVLMVPQFHVGALYLTPELAIVLANIAAYLMSPGQRVMLKLQAKAKLAPDIYDFVFQPQAKLAFEPGQYLECTLEHAHPDARGNRRYFTIASSPTEKVIHLGVRFYPKGSSYKRSLLALGARRAILGTHIGGDFTLPRDPKKKLMLIAGGIGITPYRSMLKYLIDTRQRRDVVVLYANRSAADIIYRDVLLEAEAKLGARVVYTLTDGERAPHNWAGAVGRVDEHMIKAVAPDYHERTFYLSGPPAMVRAHEDALKRLGVPGRHIKKDSFLGLI